MNQYSTQKEFQSSTNRAQFFIENYPKMSYREMASIFGWINKEGSQIHITRAIQRVKNIKTSLARLGIIIPPKVLTRKNLDFIRIDKEKFSNKKHRVHQQKSKTRQGMPKEGYERHTIIIRDEYYEKIKKIQKETGKTIREIMDQILSEYFEKRNNKMNITRSINTVSIAKFYEYNTLKKINYNSSYTKDFIWNNKKQKLFIDSIINKYPTPPIIFRQNNDNKTGAICFDIIDGKQRLITLIRFINNVFSISINNIEYYFKDLNNSKDLREIKKDFWQYTLQTECIVTNSENFIKEIIYRIHK